MQRSLTIGQVTARTGVGQATLRMWEARHGFPAPRRLPSGHRRYDDQDVAGVLRVLAARESGLALAPAIELAREALSEPQPSVYGALLERFEHLHGQSLDKRSLLALTRAIEDECCLRAVRPILFGCFQQERFYRQSQPRWRDLARTARRAIVLADFDRVRSPRGGPAEVPIDSSDPVSREWVLVCDGLECPACLAARERPPEPGAPRRFETVWSLEPEVARVASRVLIELVAARAPSLVADLREPLAAPAPVAGPRHVRAATAVAARVAQGAWRG